MGVETVLVRGGFGNTSAVRWRPGWCGPEPVCGVLCGLVWFGGSMAVAGDVACHHARVVLDERAGKPADPASLVDIDALIAAYYDRRPDPSDPAERVAFGTSGHRGSSLRNAFNEAHILATTEAIYRFRVQRGYSGPLFLGRNTHALSEPATRTALSVLVERGVDVLIDERDGYTPTPAVSHAILAANRPANSWRQLADGI